MTVECTDQSPTWKDTDVTMKGVVLCFEIEKRTEGPDKLKPVSALPITNGMKFVSAALGVVKAYSRVVKLVKAFASPVQKIITYFLK